MNLKNRHFLKLLDFTPEEITAYLDLAAELKAAKEKLLFATQRNSGLRGLHLVLLHRIRRDGLHCTAWREVGDIFHGLHTPFAIVLASIGASVI